MNKKESDSAVPAILTIFCDGPASGLTDGPIYWSSVP